MKIDHKESYKDFGNQFSIDGEIDGYIGKKELLEEIGRIFQKVKRFLL